MQQIKDILFNGIEKVIINKAAHTAGVDNRAAALFGSQTIVVSMNVKKTCLVGIKYIPTMAGITQESTRQFSQYKWRNWAQARYSSTALVRMAPIKVTTCP
ncbi:hypothetical protein MASR1M65_18440 [Saprospiraceae bacterium]